MLRALGKISILVGASGGGGGGSDTFIGLTDTPGVFVADKLVAVNSAGLALEFIDLGSGLGDVTGPAGNTENAIPIYSGISGKVIKDSNVLVTDDGTTLPGHLILGVHSTDTDFFIDNNGGFPGDNIYVLNVDLSGFVGPRAIRFIDSSLVDGQQFIIKDQHGDADGPTRIELDITDGGGPNTGNIDGEFEYVINKPHGWVHLYALGQNLYIIGRGSDLDVSGPLSATDNAIPVFDGTSGAFLKDSNVLVTDDGFISPGALTLSGIRDINSVFEISNAADHIMHADAQSFSEIDYDITGSDRIEGRQFIIKNGFDNSSIRVLLAATGTIDGELNVLLDKPFEWIHLYIHNGNAYVIGRGSDLDVSGPLSSTTNAIARYTDATGTLLKDSNVLVTDNGFISPGALTLGVRNVIFGTNFSVPTDYILDVGTVDHSVFEINSSDMVDGRRFIFKDSFGIYNESNILLLETEGSETIDGENEYTFNKPHQWVEFYAFGDNLYVIGRGSDEDFDHVVGPVSNTQNAIARYDGTTGTLIKDSNVLVTDDGFISPGALTLGVKEEVSNTTISSTPTDYIIQIESPFGVTTYTIQSVDIVDGRHFIFKRPIGAAGDIFIETQGSENIDNDSSYLLDKKHGWVHLYAFDGNLHVIGRGSDLDSSFLGLDDTPATFGDVGDVLVVNSTTDGLDFEPPVFTLRSFPVVTITSAIFDLVVASNLTFFTMDSASAQTINIPDNGDEAFPVNSEMEFIRDGVGLVTFATPGTATLKSRDNLVTINDQYSAVTLKKVGTDEWRLIGDLA